jgi:3-dehydroquinate synthase
LEQIRVELGERSYTIIIGSQILRRIGEELKPLEIGEKIGVVTNPKVRRLYGTTVIRSLEENGFDAEVFQVPDGERYKNLTSAGRLYDRLIQKKFERGSALIALGGGVIGDLTGFVAATYQRGIPFIQVPTTVAAQVDASIGGKTAVNHKRGKNLIGAFYQPKLVYSDVGLLSSLSHRDFLSGLAEVVKYGVIADESFFGFLETRAGRILAREPDCLLRVVKRSAEIKAEVVQRDEREGGLRRILNYGHTIGHALETATGYRKLTHGEAISIGMVYAGKLAERLGFCTSEVVERQTALLRAFGLPVALPKIRSTDILHCMERDKKVRDGKIHFVLAERIGHVVVRSVAQKEIVNVLKRLETG